MVEHVVDAASFTGDPSLTKQDFVDKLVTNVTHQDLDQATMGTTTGVVSTGAVAPGTQDGQLWNDTNAVANGPTRTLTMYHGGLSRFAGILPARAVPTASLPATGNIGELFYDTTLQLYRVYRDATTDALLHGGSGIAGWHPLDEAFVLVQNNTGGAIEANRAVAQTSTTDNTRRIAKTTVTGQQSVYGVTMEAIADTATGVIALVAGGATVLLSVDPTAAAATDVDMGDLLVPEATTAGVARSVGPKPGGPYVSAGVRQYGTPVGAFAEALAARAAGAGVGTIMVRLLGHVGAGCRVLRGATSAPTNANASQTGVGTTTADSDIVGSLVSAKHALTCSAAILMWTGSMTAGNIGVIGLRQGGTVVKLVTVSPTGGSADWATEVEVQTSNSSAVPTTLGTQVRHAATIAVAGTVTSTLDVLGYVY